MVYCVILLTSAMASNQCKGNALPAAAATGPAMAFEGCCVVSCLFMVIEAGAILVSIGISSIPVCSCSFPLSKDCKARQQSHSCSGAVAVGTRPDCVQRSDRLIRYSECFVFC